MLRRCHECELPAMSGNRRCAFHRQRNADRARMRRNQHRPQLERRTLLAAFDRFCEEQLHRVREFVADPLPDWDCLDNLLHPAELLELYDMEVRR